MIAALVLSATVALTCPEARRRNLDLALEWEHRARVCAAQRDACEARDALSLPPPVVPPPVPAPSTPWGLVVGVGVGGLVLGGVVGLVLAR